MYLRLWLLKIVTTSLIASCILAIQHSGFRNWHFCVVSKLHNIPNLSLFEPSQRSKSDNSEFYFVVSYQYRRTNVWIIGAISPILSLLMCIEIIICHLIVPRHHRQWRVRASPWGGWTDRGSVPFWFSAGGPTSCLSILASVFHIKMLLAFYISC